METRIAGVMLLLPALLTSWKLALDAASKSPKTIISLPGLGGATRSLPRSRGTTAGTWGIRAFLVAGCDRTSPASAAKHYRNLCVYFH